MKSRDEIVIIMLQWLRLYTLGSRGSRELKNFLETRLISSQVDQKLKNKEEIHGFLKRELAQRSWAWRGRFLGRGSWLQFRNQSASISPPNIMHFSRDRATIGSRSGHDRVTIGPRLGHDRATIGPRSWSWSFVDRRPLDWRRFHHVNSPIAARSRRDRGSIRPRSWSSSTTPPRRPIELQVTGGSRSHDRDPLSLSVRWRSNRADETRRHLSKKNKLIS